MLRIFKRAYSSEKLSDLLLKQFGNSHHLYLKALLQEKDQELQLQKKTEELKELTTLQKNQELEKENDILKRNVAVLISRGVLETVQERLYPGKGNRAKIWQEIFNSNPDLKEYISNCKYMENVDGKRIKDIYSSLSERIHGVQFEELSTHGLTPDEACLVEKIYTHGKQIGLKFNPKNTIQAGINSYFKDLDTLFDDEEDHMDEAIKE